MSDWKSRLSTAVEEWKRTAIEAHFESKIARLADFRRNVILPALDEISKALQGQGVASFISETPVSVDFLIPMMDLRLTIPNEDTVKVVTSHIRRDGKFYREIGQISTVTSDDIISVIITFIEEARLL